MKIKRFFAKDMRTAMTEVKDVLGPDAVIMSNKKVVGGIEIVAAVDYQSEQAESQKTKQNEDPFSSLADDNVQLSSQNKKTQKKTVKAQKSRRYAEKESGEDFAKSLNSFFGKVNAQQTKQNVRTKPQPKRDFSELSQLESKPDKLDIGFNQPKTLAEQQNWSNKRDSRPAGSATRRNAPVNRSSENKEIAKIGAEVASLRKLLEHQVSGLMWQEMERKEPIRAMVIKWL